MNRSFKYLLISAIFFSTQVLLSAADFDGDGEKITENTVLSLLEGLQSENMGLKTSSAYMLGELRIEEAIIPLMRMLKDSESEEERISAALALYKIETPLSINAVKRAGEFDDSQRVSKLATNFYNQYLRNKQRNDDSFTDSTYVSLK
ncbi:MAG: HEAT repeat domain-containing protein [Ignavibacteria bacterium]|nr:HEAT repeat domain-containing protein [Ignavibacteria bacterium]MBT8381154.1 HEAT repeat domain-containing protein [Ignavibacteria bacterium]MBT8390407.1 HEAT repeat domain-containing protein [Ignavibacteria bacterium]NNJ52597.1 hypothetical protein [Ignavibacteriaceae bacterium]NNL21652.1 hypothetical protein [Ignavibacteriaceae bacterium]